MHDRTVSFKDEFVLRRLSTAASEARKWPAGSVGFSVDGREAQMSWSHGVMESWSHGVMQSWSHGSHGRNNVMESWSHGVMQSWSHGVMESWSHGSHGRN
eukprot:scaffold434_cov186-Pinguiococcus_pyrenoidosus.AAC.107